MRNAVEVSNTMSLHNDKYYDDYSLNNIKSTITTNNIPKPLYIRKGAVMATDLMMYKPYTRQDGSCLPSPGR